MANLTKEQRAEISRRNGRRSKGPKTAREPIRTANPNEYAKRLWSRVSIGNQDECWEWTGARFTKKGNAPSGYGRINSGGKFLKAHREIYRITYPGDWNEDLLVLHSCDNPACVNPRHLRQGDPNDNVQDAIERDRMNPEKGEDRYNAKLNADVVRQIRSRHAAGANGKALADEYGVNTGTISRIVRRLRWKHVD